MFMWKFFLDFVFGFGSIVVLKDFKEEKLGRMSTTYLMYWNTISLDLST